MIMTQFTITACADCETINKKAFAVLLALFTGDCRFHASFTENPVLAALRKRVILHLDTTYCDPAHCFPLQADVCAHTLGICRHAVEAAKRGEAPRPMFVFGTYTIGKERIFMEVRNQQ